MGAVAVAGARNVSFLGCRFRHMGGTYALAIGGGSRGVVVRGCSFSDLSGGDPNPNPNPNPNRNPNPNPNPNPNRRRPVGAGPPGAPLKMLRGLLAVER